MFTNLEQVELFFKQRSPLGIKPGLDRIHLLLKAVGNPEKQLNSIHVAGTNGKGSTIRYLKEALMNNDYRVGVFTSPSLEGLRGHMTINNQQISTDEFLILFNELYPKIHELDEQGNDPTEFEIITVIAFLFFHKYAQIALIETGMGGRNDTTNCIEPIFSIITTIDYDHMQFLGDSIEEIAYQKAGIIKNNRPVIIGEVSIEVKNVIQSVAQELNSSLYELSKEYSYNQIHTASMYQQFTWSNQSDEYQVIIQQKGIHQIKNCSIAMMGLLLLKQFGFNLLMTNSLKGIERTTVPGRFEQIKSAPTVIVDGAHNVAGICSFIETVETYYQGNHKVLVFAAFKDKDVTSMVQKLVPYFSSVILTTFDHPRAASLDELHKIIQTDKENIKILDLHDLLRKFGTKQQNRMDHIYFFTGSLYFIKIIKEFFETM